MVTVDDVDAFAARIVESRRARLIALHAAPMSLYWWHDVQCSHLRFSMVSASQDRLPFGCQVVPVDGIRQIASDWLTSPWLHGIRLDTSRVRARRRDRRTNAGKLHSLGVVRPAAVTADMAFQFGPFKA
jgi:hypothetical protein